jgi:hypothetical protein
MKVNRIEVRIFRENVGNLGRQGIHTIYRCVRWPSIYLCCLDAWM